MGVFNIHSSGGLSTITCTMMEDDAVSYQVLPKSVDPNYDKRLEAIYAETGTGGSPAGLKTGLVEFKFTMFITGANQATVISNVAAVTRVLTHLDGGFIEYRPIGLGDSVLTTWYRFVQSGVPKMVKTEGLIDAVMERYHLGGLASDDQADGVLLECGVETFAWGTSDPYNPRTIMGENDVDNCYDGTHDNTFTVPATSVKGDAILPIIRINGANLTSVNDIGSVILHKRQLPAGASADHLDWREAEDHLGWNNTVSAAASGGNFRYVQGDDSGETFDWDGDTPQLDMMGKVAPIVMMKCASADDNYTMRLKSALSSNDSIQQFTDKVYIEDFVTVWKAVSFSTVDLPPAAIPRWVDQPAQIAIEDFFGGIVEIIVEADDASDIIHVDFAWFPKVDGGNYLAEIKSPGGTAHITDLQTNYMLIDCTAGAAYILTYLDDRVYDMFIASGPPLTDLMIFAGYDSQFRLLGQSNGGSGREWEREWEFRVSIVGLFMTVYPFSVA